MTALTEIGNQIKTSNSPSEINTLKESRKQKGYEKAYWARIAKH